MKKFPRLPLLKIFWFSFYLFIFIFLLKNSFGYLDNDLGWHLRVGQEILETKNVPSVNTYNYTLEGESWVDHEWLMNLFIFWVYNNFGYISLNIIFALLVVLSLGLIHLFVNKNVLNDNKNFYIILFLILLWGLKGMSPHLGVRIQEISLLNLSILLWLVFEFNNRKNYKILFVLPFLFYFWACVHGGFLLGFCVVFSYLGFKLAEFFIFKFFKPGFIFKDKLLDIKDFFLFFFAGVLSLFTTFFTPYFSDLYIFLGDYWKNRYYLNHIEEWLGQYYLPLNYPQFTYIALVFTVLVLIIIMFRQEKRVLEKLDWWWYFLVLVLAIMSFQSRRNFPLFFLASLPLVSGFVYYSFEKDFLFKKFKEKKVLITDSLKIFLIVVFIFFSFVTFEKINWVNDPFNYYWSGPVQAVKFLKKHPEWYNYNIYKIYGWGGYLLWTYPEKKLFVDGRLPQYPFAGHTIMEEHDEFFKQEKVEEKLDQYNIRIVLLRNGERKNKYDWFEERFLKRDSSENRKQNHLKDYLENSEEWSKVFYNNNSVVYVKN